MITYYGYTISPNQLETGEGFLICRNVPIARTGTQDYLGSEVGKPDEQIVTVERTEEEVFSPAAMASFEGKPFTDDHPPVLLTPENAGQYEKGHVQNVRRGTGEFKDFLVADIHIHDAATIAAIQNGKRQISCGYECEYAEQDGRMYQKDIRGNHVALVDEGRAGDKAAIMDAKTAQAAEPPERTKPMSKKASFLHFFGLAVNGKTEDEVRRMAEDAAPMFDEDTAPEHEPEGEPIPEEDEKPEETTDETPAEDGDIMKSIDGKLDKLIALLTPQTAEKPEEEVDPLDDALATIGKEIRGETAEDTADEEPASEPGVDENTAEQEEAHVVPAEEMDKENAGNCMDAQTAKSLILAMRPAIAAISNEAERKAATDALLSLVKRPVKAADSDAAKIAQAAQNNARNKAQNRPATDLDAIQKMYDARNPHIKKED